MADDQEGQLLKENRAERLEEMRAELVSEINRQVQAEHGVGEKAAAEANIVFSRLDLDELAEAAYSLVERQIMASFHTAMGNLQRDIDKARARGERFATGHQAEGPMESESAGEAGSALGMYETSIAPGFRLRCKDKSLLQYCQAMFQKRFYAMRRALPNERNPSQADLVALRSECTRILKKEALDQQWYDFTVVDGKRKVLRDEHDRPILLYPEVIVG